MTVFEVHQPDPASQDLAEPGRHYAGRQPVEEIDAEVSLELANTLGERGLAEVKLLRCGAHAAVVYHGQKVAKEARMHCAHAALAAARLAAGLWAQAPLRPDRP